MPTAYLSPSQLQDLTNVSSTAPVSGDNGKALVWNQTAGKWQAEQVAYSNLSGAPALPIPVASGGTGTQTGSITGTGELTFATGGANQNINLVTTEFGSVFVFSKYLRLIHPANTNTANTGIFFTKAGTNGFFSVKNSTPSSPNFIPFFEGRSSQAYSSLGFFAYQFHDSNNIPVDSNVGVINFAVASNNASAKIPEAHRAFVFENYAVPSSVLLIIRGNGDSHFLSTTESTLTTNGAVRIDGGVGIAKNLNVGGTIKGLGAVESGAPDSTGATGTAGQIRWDDGYIYVCTATNTWKRVAISTW